MWAFLFQPHTMPFTMALALVGAIGVIELLGLIFGISFFGMLESFVPDVDVDVDANVLGRSFSWLHIGQVPFSVILVAYLTSFGILGLVAQRLADTVYVTLPLWLNVPFALIFALPPTRMVAAGVKQIIPEDETQVISSHDFIGRIATITVGTARKGLAASARFTDKYHNQHYVMVEPDTEDTTFPQGSQVVLVEEIKNGFYAAISYKS